MKHLPFARFWFLLVVLLSLAVPSVAHAQPAQPTTTDCSTGCTARAYWSGNSWGAFEKFTISNPGLHDTNSYFNRFVRVSQNGPSGFPRVEMGISTTKGSGYGDYCAGLGAGLHFFVYSWLAANFNDYNLCFFVPLTDNNTDVLMHMFSDASCDQGENDYDDYRITITSGHFNTNQCLIGIEMTGGAGNTITEEEDIVDHVTGHEVWGSHWVLNQWVDSNIVAHYQTRDFDFRTSPVPPQMTWHIVPAVGNNGGELYTCDYDSGVNACTYGS